MNNAGHSSPSLKTQSMELCAPKGTKRAEKIAELENALSLAPENTDLLNQLGRLCWRAERYGEAIDYLEYLMRLDPSHAGASSKLGRLYEKLGYYPQARKWLELAHKLNPDDISTLYRLSHVFIISGEPALAEAALSKCRKSDPNNAGVIKTLGHLFLDRKKYTAFAALMGETASHPELQRDHGYLYMCAKGLLYIGNVELARHAAGAAYELDPQRIYAIIYLACCPYNVEDPILRKIWQCTDSFTYERLKKMAMNFQIDGDIAQLLDPKLHPQSSSAMRNATPGRPINADSARSLSFGGDKGSRVKGRGPRNSCDL